MRYKIAILLNAAMLISIAAFSQSFKFAFVTDTHIGNPTAPDDLRRTVKDINANKDLKFVVITGDITEFGSDNELKLAKQVLDSLDVKYYIIPGNHDSNWSESGSNTFKRVFGAETFAFDHNGYRFCATSSGPNMRMGPGQIPRENVVWLDSVVKATPQKLPLIFLNHYPQDSALNNWYNIIDRLKTRNIQLILCGHGHANHKLNFEGIPAIMGRSNLRAKDSIGGYNIVTIADGKASFEERTPVIGKNRPWAEVTLADHHFDQMPGNYPRPSYARNNQLTAVKPVWTYQDQSDIGSGMALFTGKVILTDTKGLIYALDRNTGKRAWSYATGGKLYSTPAVKGRYVVAGSSDDHIYCVDANTGKLIWRAATDKAVVASPVIAVNKVLIGSSDGKFRALDLTTGKPVWTFDQVIGFVVTKPLLYQGNVYFGCWNNDFYCLNVNTGALVWKWNNGATSRMLSPAACYPVAAYGRVFIVAPDQYMTAFDASNGKVIWRKKTPKYRVRESIGLSGDSAFVYAKTMDGQVIGVSTRADSMQVDWQAKLQLPYELAPSALIEDNGIVYVPTHSGIVYAVERKSGNTLWSYKVSNSLVNPVTANGKDVFVSTMDGKVVRLSYKK
ncbi:PQQ-binding-like beta-propeller repeat protein [Mucilaginibacter daejeonensis]|uniref:outer membrane protein assembly factor BamB family protein n=1 Tax=Mucilaginibacter daejeonensis TaxID=398049 RepID=UPI001D17A8F0|nr:PQQ-binding-like beta-propeller repeat protein [Mucilaginibacter daejeonensis]UEG51508.1 PQQ-binding-like beta-propeller repeat protein [Mucilaginibacter daejeonensis]